MVVRAGSNAGGREPSRGRLLNKAITLHCFDVIFYDTFHLVRSVRSSASINLATEERERKIVQGLYPVENVFRD